MYKRAVKCGHAHAFTSMRVPAWTAAVFLRGVIRSQPGAAPDSSDRGSSNFKTSRESGGLDQLPTIYEFAFDWGHAGVGAGSISHGLQQESGSLIQGFSPFGKLCLVHVPHMEHLRPYIKGHSHSVLSEVSGKPNCVA